MGLNHNSEDAQIQPKGNAVLQDHSQPYKTLQHRKRWMKEFQPCQAEQVSVQCKAVKWDLYLQLKNCFSCLLGGVL